MHRRTFLVFCRRDSCTIGYWYHVILFRPWPVRLNFRNRGGNARHADTCSRCRQKTNPVHTLSPIFTHLAMFLLVSMQMRAVEIWRIQITPSRGEEVLRGHNSTTDRGGRLCQAPRNHQWYSIFFFCFDSGRTSVCAEYGYPKGSPDTNS
jgi:hypothetical protein